MNQIKNQKKLEKKCFWTWPFGHVWQSEGKSYYRYGECYRMCLKCGKRSVVVDTYYG